MTVKVRSADIKDVEHLALVGASTFLETFAGVLDGRAVVAHCLREHSSTAYNRYLRTGASAWLAETDAGASPVGFSLLADADLPGSSADGSDVELKRIYLLSRFHGLGVGNVLMQAALNCARLRNAKRLLLGVYARNDRARSFYAKSGFTQIAARRFRVGTEYYDDVVLARNVTESAD